MSLPHLPNELQDLIINNLHPKAAIPLSKTNHHYHSTVSLHRLVPDTVRRFLYGVERRHNSKPEYGASDKRYACYNCLSIKPEMQFLYWAVVGSCTMEYSEDLAKRQCVDCELKDGLLIPGGIYACLCKSFDKSIVVCNDCLEAQEYFCRGCRSCSLCLNGKGAELCADCGWCDTCKDMTLEEWIKRQEFYEDDDDYARFDKKKACDHHYPGRWKGTGTENPQFHMSGNAEGHEEHQSAYKKTFEGSITTSCQNSEYQGLPSIYDLLATNSAPSRYDDSTLKLKELQY